jgi:hypothetical protein
MSMWWKFLIGLAFGLFCGSLALISILLTVHQQRQAFLSVTPDLAPQKFLDLSAEEINRRTLTAAAAVNRSDRRY